MLLIIQEPHQSKQAQRHLTPRGARAAATAAQRADREGRDGGGLGPLHVSADAVADEQVRRRPRLAQRAQHLRGQLHQLHVLVGRQQDVDDARHAAPVANVVTLLAAHGGIRLEAVERLDPLAHRHRSIFHHLEQLFDSVVVQAVEPRGHHLGGGGLEDGDQALLARLRHKHLGLLHCDAGGNDDDQLAHVLDLPAANFDQRKERLEHGAIALGAARRRRCTHHVKWGQRLHHPRPRQRGGTRVRPAENGNEQPDANRVKAPLFHAAVRHFDRASREHRGAQPLNQP